MTKRLASALLLLALACSLTGTSLAKSKKKKAASFDYYLLTMSWAPQFCATNPKGKSSSECDPKKHYGFVVHGLWPQNNSGSYPHDCGIGAAGVAGDCPADDADHARQRADPA